MLRTGLLTIAMIVALQGFCFGQGFLDSLLGPGGLGLWGGGDAASQQYNNPQMWGGAQGPAATLPTAWCARTATDDLSACRRPGLPAGLSSAGWLSAARVWPAATGSLFGLAKLSAGTYWRQPAAVCACRRSLPLRSNTRPSSNIRPSSNTKPHSGIRLLRSKPLLQDLHRAAPGQPALRPGQYVPGQAPVTRG